MKNFILLVLFAFNIVICIAQKEYLHIVNSNYVEINFNTINLKPIFKNKYVLLNIVYNSDMANINRNMYSFYGNTFGTICNTNGEIILYADGRHIYDSNDLLLYRNDKNINLDLFTRTQKYNIRTRYLIDSMGGISTHILKKPGCNDEYYLFYTTHTYAINANFRTKTDDTLTYTAGCSIYYYNFTYTKQKGINVLSNPILLVDSVLPQFTFCKASNNIDNWIVTRKFREDTYLSFKFDDNGISSKSVESKFEFSSDTSRLNEEIISNDLLFETYKYYHLGFSPNSKYLYTYYYNSELGYEKRFYSFDNESGKIVDLKVNLSLIDYSQNNYLNFSSNSEYVYFCENEEIIKNENILVSNQYAISNLINNIKTSQSFKYYNYFEGYRYRYTNFSGYYNRIYYTTYDSTLGQKYYPRYSYTEILNVDSNVKSIKFKNNYIKYRYVYDTISSDQFNLGEYYSYPRPIPGGYYGTDIYKEKCPNDSIRLAIQFELDEKDSLYEWTGPNGFTSKQRNPILFNVGKENQGWYDLKVYDPKIDCYRNFALHLEVKDTAEVNFIESSSQRKNRITFLKANESIKLFIPKNNYEKVWSTGETGDTITVTKPGRYTLKLNTDRWCENITYIDVVEDTVVVIAADDASFNQHKISDQNIVTKKIRINCESFQYDLKVYDYVNSNPDVFETNLPQLGGTTIIQFKPGGYYEFEVKFKPKEKRKYFDSIVFFSNARIIDNVTYLYGEGVDSIASVEDEPKVILDITQSTHIELYDVLGRSIATFTSYEMLKAEIENYPPPHLIKWRDEKGIFHFEKMK